MTRALEEGVGETLELAVIDGRRFETLGDVREFLRGVEADALWMLVDYAISGTEPMLLPRELRRFRGTAVLLANDLRVLGKLAAQAAPSSFEVCIQNDWTAAHSAERRDLLALGLEIAAARDMETMRVRTLVRLLREELTRPTLAS